MKRFFIALTGLCFSLVALAQPVKAQEDLLTLTQEAGYPATADMVPKASIVIDADSGQLLWGKKSTQFVKLS